MIYLDHAATTPTDPRVVEAMMPYLTYEFGNPGSLHCYGKSAKDAVDHAREQVACFFNCSPDQIIFTSGGTEGNNTVFAGITDELRRRGKNTVIISGIEHDSVWKSAQRMKIKDGFHISVCMPDKRGIIEGSFVDNLIDENTGLVSVMAANNETGVVNDIGGIALACSENGVLFHADAVQFASVKSPDTRDFFRGCDFITVSGHKLGGPKGTGALFVRDRKLLSPLVTGGAEQEFGLRGGTENVPGIVGLGKACELAVREREYRTRIMEDLFADLVTKLSSRAKKSGVEMRINGGVEAIMPKTLNVCFPGVDAESLLLLLDSYGIRVSAGSACRAHENVPSRTLTAMGISDEDARSSIRISLSHTNTHEEIDEAVNTMIDCVLAMDGVYG